MCQVYLTQSVYDAYEARCKEFQKNNPDMNITSRELTTSIFNMISTCFTDTQLIDIMIKHNKPKKLKRVKRINKTWEDMKKEMEQNYDN